MSADGKIDTVHREGKALGSRLDRDRLDELRALCDAIVVGAGTIRAEDPPMGVRDPARRHRRASEGRPAQPTVAVVSRSGDVPLTSRFLQVADDDAAPRLLAVPEDLDPFATAPFDALEATGRLRVLRLGAGSVDLHALVAQLQAAGARLVVVEGGGDLVAAFLAAGLLDELRLTLVPVIIGGRSAPGPVGGDGGSYAERRRLTLLESERVGDELYLRYEVNPPAPGTTLANP